MSSPPSPLADLLAALSRAFASLGVRWYVFGAQAAILHGAARLTADVDVTIASGEASTAAIADALSEHGFDSRVGADHDFVERTRVLPLVHRATHIPVDAVLAGPGLEELFFERAETRAIGNLSIPVLCAEDLVATKVLAGRPKDLEDVVAVLQARRERIDLARIRETLTLLEKALDRADLLRELERTLARLR